MPNLFAYISFIFLPFGLFAVPVTVTIHSVKNATTFVFFRLITYKNLIMCLTICNFDDKEVFRYLKQTECIKRLPLTK